MLTKQWQGLLQEVDQKVGIVPELGSTSVGVKRFGPELKRRTLCARQFERFYENTFALAMADKATTPDIARAKRLLVPNLIVDGQARGAHCATFASLTSPATIALVETLPDEWSILALTVNPTERNIDTIVAAEYAMITALNSQVRALKAGSSSLRLLAEARETLAGSSEQLGIAPIDNSGEAAADGEKTVW
eukprot:CAMPEP_0194135030 /NCGR_PEP_ID=MMETSP0152-20130528/5108_1 /TAXON_ID=1049557 /ORGANISM="Thalassiothrix antarctica, Strain L6-D1" /LENGTH=191 /DNA_ID=CAMNT_0038831045 /DNA_START=159 /DNA_END=731 /DNA_ORIENTATION=-